MHRPRPPARTLLVEVICLECRVALVHVEGVPVAERERIDAAMFDPTITCPRHPRAPQLQRIEGIT